MATIVTGATGFVGRQLLKSLLNPIVVSREPERAAAALGIPLSQTIRWNSISGPLMVPEELNPDVVINLMGEPVGQRWTDSKKHAIRASRIDGTKNLAVGLLQSSKLPRVLVSASAVGFYGSRGEEQVDESFEAGAGFLAETCREWEAAATALQSHGVRVVIIRIGIVLGQKGGVLQQLVPVFRSGLGGKMGDGQHWFPWIHLDDLVALIVWAASVESRATVVNGVAPNPVRNIEFTQALARQLHRPSFFRVPKFVLKGLFGEFADSLFDSQRVVPQAALDLGFVFRHPTLTSALQDLLP